MLRTYKLLLFYAGVVLAAFDANAIVQRFFFASPDPIAWEKVAVAALLQGAAFGIALPYLAFISRVRTPLLGRNRSLLFALDLRLAPLLACGILCAFSVTVLFNAVNCGNHPLPTNRGMSVCPK